MTTGRTTDRSGDHVRKIHHRQLKSTADGLRTRADNLRSAVTKAGDAVDSYGRLRCLADGGGCFHALLELAKIQWRYDLADPAAPLREAADLALGLVPTFRQLTAGERDRQGFPFPNAGYVFLLLDGVIPPPVRACWPTGREISGLYPETVPDAMTLKAVATGRRPPGWDRMLATAARHQSQLFVQTYSAYLSIILAAAGRRWEEAAGHAREADGLYPRRERNVVDFRSSDGGGPSNLFVLDHRLAVILKVCFGRRPSALDGFETLHRWRG